VPEAVASLSIVPTALPIDGAAVWVELGDYGRGRDAGAGEGSSEEPAIIPADAGNHRAAIPRGRGDDLGRGAWQGVVVAEDLLAGGVGPDLAGGGNSDRCAGGDRSRRAQNREAGVLIPAVLVGGHRSHRDDDRVACVRRVRNIRGDEAVVEVAEAALLLGAGGLGIDEPAEAPVGIDRLDAQAENVALGGVGVEPVVEGLSAREGDEWCVHLELLTVERSVSLALALVFLN
jgi:hypothetical protein